MSLNYRHIRYPISCIHNIFLNLIFCLERCRQRGKVDFETLAFIFISRRTMYFIKKYVSQIEIIWEKHYARQKVRHISFWSEVSNHSIIISYSSAPHAQELITEHLVCYVKKLCNPTVFILFVFFSALIHTMLFCFVFIYYLFFLSCMLVTQETV